MLGTRVRGRASEDLTGRGNAAAGRTWVLALVLILCAITPLADSSPPDPLWIAGIYDAADQDEVVGLVTSTSATANPLTGESLLLPIVFIASLAEAHGVFLCIAERSSASVRAPPTI
ncbi:MAG: hypothetical protein C5B48_05805 [Candidatus Rokuibacteriota bacterium]|nr:MAG: hypothetical protein C5B48_05805 [Candidatus Rokubacteria bacterium]